MKKYNVNLLPLKRGIFSNNLENLVKSQLIDEIKVVGIKKLETLKKINEYVFNIIGDGTLLLFKGVPENLNKNEKLLFDIFIDILNFKILNIDTFEYRTNNSNIAYFNNEQFVLYKTDLKLSSDELINIVNNLNIDDFQNIDIIYFENDENDEGDKK